MKSDISECCGCVCTVATLMYTLVHFHKRTPHIFSCYIHTVFAILLYCVSERTVLLTPIVRIMACISIHPLPLP